MIPPADSLGVHLVERLDLDDCPTGAVTRLRIPLAHDGLGDPISVPILVARGRRPGPVLGLTAAVHGNELNGIPVIHHLFRRLDVSALRGTVVAVVVVNVPGFHRHKRVFSDGTDLNHIMPGRAAGTPSQVWVHRLLDRVLQGFDRLVDLHTASFGRINPLYVRADMQEEVAARMAYLLRPQIIVHNPPSDLTLRGTADERGTPAVTLEIGNPHRFQPKYIRSALAGIRAILADMGMIPRRPVVLSAEPVLCQRSYWLYTDRGGLLEVDVDLTDRVEDGQAFARLRNIFGDLTAEYRAPEAGVIVGRSVNPVAETGARLVHLGIEVTPEHKLLRHEEVGLQKAAASSPSGST